MNLHGLVRGAIQAVNPDVLVTVHWSNGYTTQPDGTQVPAYTIGPDVPVQLQALSAQQLQHLNNLGYEGVMRAAYLEGDAQGVVRHAGRGGDLFVFGGRTWLVVQVIETWPDWCKVALCLQ